MARTLLKVPVGDDDDGFIEVEVDRRDLEGVDLASDDGDGAARAPFSLSASLGKVMPAINTILTRLRSAEQAPDEIGMQLGLTVGGETGLIFTKGTAEANFTLTVTWRKPEPAGQRPDGRS
ncbi:MAG TPA: CU044_2847 family protein [Micromonosporaceae bacterium]|nr:CU044_2847 family protein [Micromonosporaceae bacterium]